MSYKTYSFEDVKGIISHDSVGTKSTSGQGLGTITVAMTADRTAHDLAADGTIMISKLPGRHGNIAISMQQTSSLHKWLLKWYNYLEAADSSEWAGTTVTVKNTMMEDLITATGVSPQKLPDRPYQAQGQMVTWTLMAADIQQENS